jgi:tetratricopeptide (TPR) repeat protein
MTTHVWIVGPRAADRASATATLPAAEIRVDCHRNLRGPYTGLSAMLLGLVPRIYQRWPDLVRAHQIEILTAAPQLQALIEARPETLTALALGEERTRFYSEARSRRTPHGIVELLAEYVTRRGQAPLVLAFDNVHAADPSDQEFLAILLRRADPSRLCIHVGTNTQALHNELTAALRTYARLLNAAPSEPATSSERRDDEALLRAFIAADGTSDDPAEQQAWETADPTPRAALHDGRADELERGGDFGHRLGAIPYHREHGSDPVGAGTKALRYALDYCIDLGFYSAAADLGMRGYALTDPDHRQQDYCHFAAKAALALISLGFQDKAMALYIELRGRYPLPRVHMSTSYNMAMLYTRFLPRERLDHELARAYASNGVALATLTEDPEERAFYTVFQQNGLALVEMHRGNLTGALQLVTEGVDRLVRETSPEKYRLHKSVLIHNRANVYAGLGMMEKSMADFNTVISLDPNYPEYYLDRGNMARRLGDDDAAVADYEKAMSLGPPFPELYYNRGDVRAAHGDLAGAIADFSYALELEPEHLDARISHVALLLDSGNVQAAGASVTEGLAFHPSNPRLLCARGSVAMETGDIATARSSFEAALRVDPGLYPALVNSAVLSYEQGDYDAAVDAFTQALEQAGDDPDLLYSRGYAHQAAGRFGEAIDDYTRALGLPGADLEELLYQRAISYAATGHDEESRADLGRHLALGPSPHAEEIRDRLSVLAQH